MKAAASEFILVVSYVNYYYDYYC